MKLVLGDPANIDNIMVDMGNHRFPNMGILYILGYLRKKMPGLEVFYLRGDLSLQDYIARLNEIRPDIYGISFSSWVSDIAYKTIDAVKAEFPGIPIICGGTHSTVAPKEVLENSRSDICAIGEGEETALELAEYFLLHKRNLSEIKGIAYKEEDIVRFTLPRSHIKNCSDIPLPAWDMIDFNEYEGLGYCKGTPNTAMIFSRGCPYNCVYCSNPVWRSSNPWLRLRAPGDIKKEVDLLYKKGIREIWIRADEFNSDLSWTLEVCRAIKELNYKDLFFECNLRADKVTEEFAGALRDINVWNVNLGIETFNQRVLDGIKKKITVQQIIDSCKVLKKYGIDIYAWLMYYQIWEDNGKLCWETPQEVDNTLRMAKRMHKEGLIDLVSWQVATPMPGSDLFDIAERHGLISKPYQYNVWKANINIPGLNKKHVYKHRVKGMILQSYIAYKKGRVSWATRKNVFDKLRYIMESFFGFLKNYFGK